MACQCQLRSSLAAQTKSSKRRPQWPLRSKICHICRRMLIHWGQAHLTTMTCLCRRLLSSTHKMPNYRNKPHLVWATREPWRSGLCNKSPFCRAMRSSINSNATSGTTQDPTPAITAHTEHHGQGWQTWRSSPGRSEQTGETATNFQQATETTS